MRTLQRTRFGGSGTRAPAGSGDCLQSWNAATWMQADIPSVHCFRNGPASVLHDPNGQATEGEMFLSNHRSFSKIAALAIAVSAALPALADTTVSVERGKHHYVYLSRQRTSINPASWLYRRFKVSPAARGMSGTHHLAAIS